MVTNERQNNEKKCSYYWNPCDEANNYEKIENNTDKTKKTYLRRDEIGKGTKTKEKL